MESILEKLSGGDLRSIGRAEEVVGDVFNQPDLFPTVFEGMLAPDPVIRMRAADVIEKVTVQHPEWLQPFKDRLIHEVSAVDQIEVRWHVAQMLPRLVLNDDERRSVIQILLTYTQDNSSIVRTFAIQALADVTKHSSELRLIVISLMESLIYEGTPAMKARGSKLLEQLKNEEAGHDEHAT